MATAEDIVTRALSRLSILRIGGVPSAAQSEAAMIILNSMISAWYADGVQIDLSVPFPPQHEEGITAMLAMKIAPTYGEAAVVPPSLAQTARNGWQRLLAQYVFAPPASFDSAIRNLPSQRLLGQRGVPFNIVSVTPSSDPSVIGFVTLRDGFPTTVVVDPNCLMSSTITLKPVTAAAQTEYEAIRPIVAAGPLAGEFTITHQNNTLTNRIFEYLITIGTGSTVTPVVPSTGLSVIMSPTQAVLSADIGTLSITMSPTQADISIDLGTLSIGLSPTQAIITL